MKNLKTAITYFFSFVCFAFFILCATVVPTDENWHQILMFNFSGFILSFILASFFADPRKLFRHIHALIIVIVAKMIVSFRPNSKMAICLKKKFKSRRSGKYCKKVSYARVYRSALYDYDDNHPNNVGGKYEAGAK